MLVKPDERKKLNEVLHGLVKDAHGLSDDALIGLIEKGRAKFSAPVKLCGQEAVVEFTITGPQKLPPPLPSK